MPMAGYQPPQAANEFAGLLQTLGDLGSAEKQLSTPVAIARSVSPAKQMRSSASPPQIMGQQDGAVNLVASNEFAIDPELLAGEASAFDVQLGTAAQEQLQPDPSHGFVSPEGQDPPVGSTAVLPKIDTVIRSKSTSPPHLIKSWSILNEGGSSTQPGSAVTDSPITPLGTYDSITNSPTGYDFSRNSSAVDLLSPLKGSVRGSTDSVDGDYQPSEAGEGGVPGPKKKKSHARKQPEGHIKRARNAFILFRKHVTDSNLIPPSVEVKHQNISVVAAKMWREAPPDVRKKFQEMARIEKEEHQRRYPGYRYQPVFRRTDIIRRRVRKDPAEDEKVEAVAEALMKGKAGEALETEIKEQMAQRSDASESEAEPSKAGASRRRRREQGQLSKGAIRAQRAQARAKQMRQNLLGHNLLQVSMYNAQQQQQQQQRQLGAASQAPGLGYGLAESYMPVAYDYDGRPIMDHHRQGGHGYPAPPPPQAGGDPYGQPMYGGADEGYRLPPIMGYDAPPHAGGAGGLAAPQGPSWAHEQSHLDAWGASGGGSYGEPQPPPDGGYYHHAHAGDGQMLPNDFSLPPLGNGSAYPSGPDFGDNALGGPSALSGPSAHGQAGGIALPEFATSPQLPTARPAELIAGQYARDIGLQGGESRAPADSRSNAQNWPHEAPETPSGHMVFQDRLFDGALGSAMLSERREDDGLGAFDEAVQQVHGVSAW